MWRWCVVLLLFWVQRLPEACPVGCKCISRAVDCSRAGLTTIPRDIPDDTVLLDLNGNEIEEFVAPLKLINLTTLDLSSNRLAKFESSALDGFPQLRILNLRRNRLRTLPLLPPLERLDLARNNLVNVTSRIAGRLSRIRVVDLSRNGIRHVNGWHSLNTSTVRIERLDLAGNHIRFLPNEVFSSLSSLNSLRLVRNKIHSIEKYSFHGLLRLQILDISRNSLGSLQSLIFNSLPSLTFLSLSRNKINNIEDGVFFGCEGLETVNISSNNVRSLSEGALFGLHRLQTLDISFNNIPSLEPSLWSQVPNLRWLSVEGNSISSVQSGAFLHLPFLETLSLARNQIQNVHKTALTGLHHLSKLDISENHLSLAIEEGIFLHNTSLPLLKDLSIARNEIRVIPARTFERSPALETLDLSNNPLATIKRGAFDSLKLTKLNLNTSSVLCDCEMAWFGPWLFRSGLDRSRLVVRCVHPLPLRHLLVHHIDPANLTCAEGTPRARVVSPPLAFKALVKGEANYSCTAQGIPPLHIQWRAFQGGRPRVLEEDTSTAMSASTESFTEGVLSGFVLVRSTLVLSHVTLTDKGDYQCVASNQFGLDHSPKVPLQVFQMPSFIYEPDDMARLVGQHAQVKCAASGLPTPMLKWSKDGGEAFPAALERRLHVRPNDDHLYILNVSLADQGVYTCHASNDAGNIQASATLRVFNTTFRTNVESFDVAEGDTVVLDCLADIIPGMQRISWTKNGEPFRLGTNGLMKAHDQILVISKVTDVDSGDYECRLWAGHDVLANQKTQVRVQTARARTEPSRVSRLPIALFLVFICFVSCGLCWSIIFCRRTLLGRRNLPVDV